MTFVCAGGGDMQGMREEMDRAGLEVVDKSLLVWYTQDVL